MSLPHPFARLSPVGILNATANLADVDLQSSVEFDAASGLSLDVYTPQAPTRKSPIAIFIYGGGWDSGDKSMYRFVGAALASRGITTVIPDYRVYPKVRFPTFLEDAAKAVRWATDRLCGDGRRPVLIGHSAGAHIAAMLALDGRWLDAEGLDPYRDVAGFVGLSGPYDFLPLHSDRLREILGPEDRLPQTQPINFVTSNAPPSFLAAGRLDRTVDPQNSVRLANRIRAAGGHAELKLYRFAAHASLIGAFAWPLTPVAPVLGDTVAFVRAVTAMPAGVVGHEEVPAC